MGNVTSSSAPAVPNTFNYFSQGRDWTGDADGEHQSPINIVPGTTVASDDTMKMELFLGDKPLSNLKVVDTGATLLLEGAVSKLKATDVNGDAYDFEAIQFHFHAPSEHTINGGFYELELHIVHQMTPESQARAKTQRNLAVVAVFFQLDKKSTSGHPFFDALNIKELGSNITLNMNHLLGEDLVDGMKYFAYQGSLTTPPCTENANFYVFEKPLPISQEQLKEFTMRWADNPLFANGNGNNRPVQPLNGRTVKHSCSCCVKPASHEHKRHIEEVIPEGLPSFEIPQPFPLVSFNHKISLNNHHFTSKNTVLNPASNQESLENVANSNLSLDKFMGNALSSNLKVSGSNTLTSGAQGGMTDSQADAIYNKMGQMAKYRGNANSKVGGLISRPRIANILKKIVK